MSAKAKISTLYNFNHDNIKDTKFKESHITGTINNISDSFYYDCIFENVTFEGHIWNTNFIRCKFINSSFNETACTKVSFKRSKLIGADFTESRLKIVSFRETNLKYADFTDSRFLQIRIEEANLTGTNLIGTNLNELIHGSGALNMDKSITD